VLRILKMSKERLIAATISRPRPLDGETWRSSFNYSTSLAESTATQFIVRISPYNPKWQDIQFSIARSVTIGGDETLHRDLFSGNRISAYLDDRLYIGDPKGADEKFTVEIYEVRKMDQATLAHTKRLSCIW